MRTSCSISFVAWMAVYSFLKMSLIALTFVANFPFTRAFSDLEISLFLFWLEVI